MDFGALKLTDLDDVRSLNHAFLMYLRGRDCGQALREHFAPALQTVVCGLSESQIRRLAESPFLLLSIRERDDNYWRLLLADSPTADLFSGRLPGNDEAGRILAATLGFLWQLARGNSYAARLICGASLYWCEQLAACTLYKLLQRAADRSDLVVPRLADNAAFWDRLLGSGLSSEASVRSAAHLSALQTILTATDTIAYAQMRTAACDAAVPTLKVAERPDHN